MSVTNKNLTTPKNSNQKPQQNPKLFEELCQISKYSNKTRKSFQAPFKSEAFQDNPKKLGKRSTARSCLEQRDLTTAKKKKNSSIFNEDTNKKDTNFGNESPKSRVSFRLDSITVMNQEIQQVTLN